MWDFFSFIFYLWWIKPKKSPKILTPLTMDNKGNAQLSTSAVSSTNFQPKSQPNFSRSNLRIQYSFYNFNWTLNYIRLKIEFGWNIETILIWTWKFEILTNGRSNNLRFDSRVICFCTDCCSTFHSSSLDFIKRVLISYLPVDFEILFS